MTIKENKWKSLQDKMEILGIKEQDLEEKFILSSGPGGQKLQKSAVCVYLKHLPTSIEVKCAKTRFREDNRYFARKILCEKYAQIYAASKSEKLVKTAKIRKQKKRRQRRKKDRIA